MTKDRMKAKPYLLSDRLRREAVMRGIRLACQKRGWELLAAHVRETHVHSVVQSKNEPEEIEQALKAYASRELNRIEGKCRRWTRGGSRRFLWNVMEVERAIDYVLYRQGKPMTTFRAIEEEK